MERTHYDVEGAVLNLKELFEVPRDADVFLISPHNETDFAAAVASLIRGSLMFRMLENGFEFGHDGRRLRFETVSDIPLGTLKVGSITVINFKGVHDKTRTYGYYIGL